MVFSEDPWYKHLLPSGSGAVITCFYESGLSSLGFKHPAFRMRGERSERLRTAAAWHISKWRLVNIFFTFFSETIKDRDT